MKLTDDMLRAAFAVLFDKHAWERDAAAEQEVREALQAALDAREPERRQGWHGRACRRVASRQHWARVAARNAASAE